MPRWTQTLEERFWEKVDLNGPLPPDPWVPLETNCWLWTAGRSGAGYGAFKINGKQENAHRVAYELLVGPIPDGLQIDHLCRVRACVRPDHLEPVTGSVNVLRGDLLEVAHERARQLTHCPQGHLYSGDNLIVRPEGGKKCRECQRAAWRRYNAKRPERQDSVAAS